MGANADVRDEVKGEKGKTEREKRCGRTYRIEKPGTEAGILKTESLSQRRPPPF